MERRRPITNPLKAIKNVYKKVKRKTGELADRLDVSNLSRPKTEPLLREMRRREALFSGRKVDTSEQIVLSENKKEASRLTLFRQSEQKRLNNAHESVQYDFDRLMIYFTHQNPGDASSRIQIQHDFDNIKDTLPALRQEVMNAYKEPPIFSDNNELQWSSNVEIARENFDEAISKLTELQTSLIDLGMNKLNGRFEYVKDRIEIIKKDNRFEIELANSSELLLYNKMNGSIERQRKLASEQYKELILTSTPTNQNCSFYECNIKTLEEWCEKKEKNIEAADKLLADKKTWEDKGYADTPFFMKDRRDKLVTTGEKFRKLLINDPKDIDEIGMYSERFIRFFEQYEKFCTAKFNKLKEFSDKVTNEAIKAKIEKSYESFEKYKKRVLECMNSSGENILAKLEESSESPYTNTLRYLDEILSQVDLSSKTEEIKTIRAEMEDPIDEVDNLFKEVKPKESPKKLDEPVDLRAKKQLWTNDYAHYAETIPQQQKALGNLGKRLIEYLSSGGEKSQDEIMVRFNAFQQAFKKHQEDIEKVDKGASNFTMITNPNFQTGRSSLQRIVRFASEYGARLKQHGIIESLFNILQEHLVTSTEGINSYANAIDTLDDILFRVNLSESSNIKRVNNRLILEERKKIQACSEGILKSLKQVSPAFENMNIESAGTSTSEDKK